MRHRTFQRAALADPYVLPLRRVAAARDVVKRGQEVWVKVVAISGERLTLSMRDMDQSTGEDLLPGARLGAEGINPSGPAANAAASTSLRGLSGIRVCHHCLSSTFLLGCAPMLPW